MSKLVLETDKAKAEELTIEELDYKLHKNPILNELGIQHLDVINRRFMFESNWDSKYHQTPYNSNLSDKYFMEKNKLKNDLEYMRKLFWIRERYIELMEKGNLDGKSMTKEDFKQIFDITEAEFHGIAYSVFMFGTDSSELNPFK